MTIRALTQGSGIRSSEAMDKDWIILWLTLLLAIAWFGGLGYLVYLLF